MSKLRLVLLIALCAVWPATARAQSDFIDWLQQQSGPGPYWNQTRVVGAFDVRFACWSTPGAPQVNSVLGQWRRCLIDNPNDVTGSLSFGMNWGTTGRKQLFIDDPSDVREVLEKRISIRYLGRVNHYFDFGGAFNITRFASDEGNAFGFWRVGMGPILTFFPCGDRCEKSRDWATLNRLVRFQAEATWYYPGFKASDYNNAVSKFNSGYEYQVRSSIVLDAGALVQVLWR
jgi:hypothetical protein